MANIAEMKTFTMNGQTFEIVDDKARTAIEQLVAIESLPYGGSKEWLAANGDPTKLYQIDGYVWGYVQGNGWTRSGTRFRVVSSEGAMVNVDGVPYLLRSGNEGTVYSFKEASGDADTPVYETLPETANEGDVVAVMAPVVDSVEQMTDKTKKYELSSTKTLWEYTEETVSVEHNAYDPDYSEQFNKRINSSDAVVKQNGQILTDYIEQKYDTSCKVTISGLAALVRNYGMLFKVDFFDASKSKLCSVNNGNYGIQSASGGALPIAFNIFSPTSGTTTGIENTAYIRIGLCIADDTAEIDASDCEGLVINFSTKNTQLVGEWKDTGRPNGIKYRASILTKEVILGDLTKQEGWTWNPGYRVNSSGGLTEGDEYATDYIPVSIGDIIRIKGLDVRHGASGYSKSQFFSSTMGVISCPAMNTLITNGYATVAGDVVTITAGYGENAYENTAFQRFSGKLMSGYTLDDVVITVNAEIKTSTVTELKWTEVGTYIPPTEASWKDTGEMHAIIDSISTTGNNGESAVYSVDGYLYTYISGATWMALSKYEQSFGLADSELSHNSTNAVQNKVLTAKFDEVEAATRSNSTQISELNVKVAGLITGGVSESIPTFWQDAVAACIAKIKSLQVGRNCITFPFFSDNHQRNGYAGLLIAHIMKECGIPYCFFGGDSISSGTIADEAEMIAQDKAFDAIMAYVPNGRFCRAVGNHDGYWYDGTNKFYYDRDGIYNLFLREESVAQNKHFGDDGTYYYIDDIASKVRFVVLNTNGIRNSSSTFDSTQLAWLQNTALNFTESGWAVVLISHQPLSNHYHALINNASAVISVISDYVNGSNANKADIVGCFSGHIHRDRIYTGIAVDTETDSIGSALPFTQVTITSDNTAIAYDDATKHAIGSNDKSHAIDFVTINKGTRRVNITRLGIGNDRSYTY
jgi:hypothetical protein